MKESLIKEKNVPNLVKILNRFQRIYITICTIFSLIGLEYNVINGPNLILY
jgi:hypothetical protein